MQEESIEILLNANYHTSKDVCEAYRALMRDDVFRVDMERLLYKYLRTIE